MAYKNPEHRREYARQWYAANQPRILAYRNAWAKNNPEKRSKAIRENQLRTKYGITVEEWEAMFEAQGRMCAICEVAEPGGRGWCTDHCHATNKVRAVLCFECNIALGKMRDNPTLLRRAAEYLEKHGRH